MEFGEVVEMVVERTKRADKISEIRGGINAAISLFASANFSHDRTEIENFVISSSLYAQSFDITDTPFANFKVIDYIRPTGYRKNLNPRDPKKIFQGGCEVLDTYYRSGDNIIFKLSRLQSELKIGYFHYHPILVADDDEDWMLDELTEAIVLHARGKIMRSVGEDTEANNNTKEALFLWEAFKSASSEVQT